MQHTHGHWSSTVYCSTGYGTSAVKGLRAVLPILLPSLKCLFKEGEENIYSCPSLPPILKYHSTTPYNKTLGKAEIWNFTSQKCQFFAGKADFSCKVKYLVLYERLVGFEDSMVLHKYCVKENLTSFIIAKCLEAEE